MAGFLFAFGIGALILGAVPWFFAHTLRQDPDEIPTIRQLVNQMPTVPSRERPRAMYFTSLRPFLRHRRVLVGAGSALLLGWVIHGLVTGLW